MHSGTFLFCGLAVQPAEKFFPRDNDAPADLKRREICTVGELVRSGSGNAKDGGNICHVHHQGQFFQRVILFLVHMASSLPFRESKFVFAWPRRIAQSKFLSCFLHAATVGEHGVCVAQTCTDARSACKTAHVGTTRPTPRSKWLRRCAFLTCAAVQPLVLRPQAALGSGFSLQAAFWYQNAMLALFLRSKKSLKRSLSLLSPFRTPHKI